MRNLYAATALIMIVAAPASAEEGRYRLERAGDQFVRMDTHSGAMSVCVLKDGQLACQPAAMPSGTVNGDVEARLAALERRVEVLEGGFNGTAGLPSDEEFERGLGYMERFFRRFMCIAREFSEEPAPNRT